MHFVTTHSKYVKQIQQEQHLYSVKVDTLRIMSHCVSIIPFQQVTTFFVTIIFCKSTAKNSICK